jgi:hypothetical protein
MLQNDVVAFWTAILITVQSYFYISCWVSVALQIWPRAIQDTKSLQCAVFSLEPLAQDPRESEITDMRCVNLFTPRPLRCSALTEAWKFLVVITLVWSSEEFPSQKFGIGLVAKFSFGVYSGEAKGFVLAPCVTFVCFWSFHLLLRDRDFLLLYHEASPK